LPVRLAKACYYRMKFGYPFITAARTDRMVFHARREETRARG